MKTSLMDLLYNILYIFINAFLLIFNIKKMIVFNEFKMMWENAKKKGQLEQADLVNDNKTSSISWKAFCGS